MENGNVVEYLRRIPHADRNLLVMTACFLSKHKNSSDSDQVFDVANGLEYLHAMKPTIVHGDLRGVCGLYRGLSLSSADQPV
jgi:hypothetical protein